MKIKKQFFSGVVRVFLLSLAGVLILSLGMVNSVRADGVPDLTVASTHSGDFDQGGVGSYTITVSNDPGATGSTDGVTAITVTGTLPVGLTATGMSGEGWTCPVPVGGVIPAPLTCYRTDVSGAVDPANILSVGNSYPGITLTVAVDADAAVDAPYILSNEVLIVDGGGEVNTTNNSDTDDTTITQKPNLELQMVDSGDFVQGGVDKTFTITVTNVGHAPTDGTEIVVENFTVDADLTVKSISGTNWTCVGLICTRDAAGALDILSVGDSFEDIILTVDVHVDADTSVTNEADLSGTLRGGDMDTSNNSASSAPSVTQKPDLTVEKIHSGNFTQGGVGTYTITVKNSNAYAPTAGDASITVTDILPAGLTATDMIGNNWTCPDPVNGIVPAPLTCTHPAIVLGAGLSLSDTITVTVKVAANAAASVTNTVTVSGGGQVNLSNDSDPDLTTIDPATDLTLTNITPEPTSPVPDQDFVVRVTGQNQGRLISNSYVTVDLFVVTPEDLANPDLWPVPCNWVDSDYNSFATDIALDGPIGPGLPIDKAITITDGLHAGTHTVYAIVDSGCIVDESDETNNVLGPIVVNIRVARTISGNVGMQGVSLNYTFDGISNTVVSDANGNYVISVLSNSTGTVTPVKAGYVFSPQSKSYSNLTANQVQNFITRPGFAADGALDGWILETAENGNKGGTMNNTINALYLGDDKVRKQYRSILSFNTAGLPDNATITSVILRIRRSVVGGGGNPITILGGFMVDIRKGFLGASILQLTDFQAPAQMTVGPFIPALVNGWYTINLTSAKTLVDKSGTIQIRLRFRLDDNNDSRSNIMSFYSSNAGAVAYHPFLLVTYTLP